MNRTELSAAIEDACRDAAEDFGHPQAVDTIGDARDEILTAVDAYVAAREERTMTVLRATVALLRESVDVVNGLADQQAMPDPWYEDFLSRAKEALADE